MVDLTELKKDSRLLRCVLHSLRPMTLHTQRGLSGNLSSFRKRLSPLHLRYGRGKLLWNYVPGLLTSSQFVLILNGFRHLILSQYNMPDLKYRQHPMPPTHLAKAILTLAKVFRKNLLNATFTGGLDCVWLAALAERVLSLDVGILGSSGLSIYLSRSGVGILS